MRRSLLVSGVVLLLLPSITAAQGLRPSRSYARYEISPIGGYMWGGSADFSSQGGQPGGSFEIGDSFMYGVELAFRGTGGSWVEATYRRQDTKLSYRENGTGTKGSTDFATNYIHIGGRQDFITNGNLTPYIRGSLGATVFDVKRDGIGTHTDFSLSVGGGATYMLPNGKVGLRANLQGWFTFVPTNEVGIYCSPFFPYYCYAATGSQTVSQGEVSGALVFRF